MDEPSPQVLRIDFARKPEQQPEPPEPFQPKSPPAHLDEGAKRAWADIVAAARPLTDEDEPTIEVAAVFLAHLRDDGRRAALAVRLNNLLIELGLSPGARAGIQPDQALAAFSRTRRARDAAGLARDPNSRAPRS